MRIIFLLFILILVLNTDFTYASTLPGVANSILQTESIRVGTVIGGNIFDMTRDAGFRILTALKVTVSGFALIWIVMIGAYMIMFSENEDRIKAQKKQFSYMLIGFIFLNLPGLIYTVFFGDVVGSSRNMGTIGDGVSVDFWDSTTLFGLNGFVPQLIGFFEIFIFGVAILTFTWGFFRLILSSGNEEIQKKAKNRIIYGILGLTFIGFSKYWGTVIAKGDFFGEFATLGRKFLGLALYFAAPVVVAFLVLAAYYMITSAGDEERIKKAKSIFLNTFIASLILLGAYSFVTDLATFII